MKTLTAFDLLKLLFVISSFTCCYAENKETVTEDETSLKGIVVEDILKKVCNLSISTFANKTQEEKNILMIKIEEKFRKLAEKLGAQGEEYVELLMKGIKAKVFVMEHSSSNVTSTNVSREGAKNEPQNEIVETDEPGLKSESKEQIIKDIAIKIKSLAETYLANAKTEVERDRVIQYLKNKFIESAMQKHPLIHERHENLKNYVDLVSKGLKMIMKQNSENVKRRQMKFEYASNISLNKDSQAEHFKYLEPIRGRTSLNNDLEHAKVYNIKSETGFIHFNKDKDLKSSTLKYPCNDALQETCHKIKLMKTIQCLSENKEISLLKLCNGVVDCLDFSDEQHCAKQAIESIQRANQAMQFIDNSLSVNCYPDAVDESVVSKQNEILNNVLQNQLTFLQTHSLDGSATFSRRVFSADTQAIKKAVTDAVLVVKSLSLALESSLCSKLPNFKSQYVDHDDAEPGNIENIEYQTSTSSPEFCQCNGQNCIKKCTPGCKKICWEKYSLSQWQCSAISGERTVSLDMLCDGKFDCYDETDEKDCSRDISLAKFEATQMYNYLVKMITGKAESQSFEALRNKFLNLRKLIIKLQKLTLKRNFDILEVKRLREACFSELTAIYDSALRYQDPRDLLNLYIYLLALNERLVSALKRSHTGNDKIISPDGCVCRGYQCALPRCSKSCIRACSAEPKLKRYFCTGTVETNNSVPIELICNGKQNCPYGDDEKDCREEVCRAHHLVLLRHNLRDVGKLQQGTALGEALRSWKVKVMATLMVAENNDRPTPVVMRDIIHDILHDLVMTYATVEENRRSDSIAIFSEFYMWSRVVIDALKSCTK